MGIDESFAALDAAVTGHGFELRQRGITWATGCECLLDQGWPEDVVADLITDLVRRAERMAVRDDGVDVAYERAVEA